MSDDAGFWNTYWMWRSSSGDRRCTGRVTSVPSKRSLPCWGGISPAMERANVVLPLPLSPTRATVSPELMVNEACRTAGTGSVVWDRRARTSLDTSPRRGR